MKQNFTINGIIRKTLLGSAIWLLSQTSAVACDDLYYVVWVEGEATTNIYVRHRLVDASGVNDNYGIIDLPDDALGGNNPGYMYTLAVNAFMNSTKLRIFTDDTDCVISSDGEILGTATDIETADLF